MIKIKSLFERNYDGDRLVNKNIVAGSEWVISGEGIATRKFDGTSAMIRDERIYKRYDVKKGKTVPVGAIPCQEPDEITGHHPHWVLCDINNPSDKFFFEAFDALKIKSDGTYELCGPKVQGNPEGLKYHTLIPHGKEILFDCPRDFDGLKKYLENQDIEGVVWHHPDGRMVKIKAKDFGLRRI